MSATSPRRVADAARRAIALQLRAAGRTYESIANSSDEHGAPLYSSRQAAARAVARALAELPAESVEQLRAVEGARLDKITAELVPLLEHGRQVRCPDCGTVIGREPSIPAAVALIRVSERRSRLHGLDHSDELLERWLVMQQDAAEQLGAAVRHAVRAGGFDPDTADQLLDEVAAYLRAHDTEQQG